MRMTRGISILVVDDEALVREAVQRLLEHDGYEVESFPDGQSALKRLQERKFDLVITDFSMPGMAGDELVARIRGISSGQRIILATAYVDEFRVFGQPQDNVDAVLLKPFSFKELSEAVELVMAREGHDASNLTPPIIERSHSQDFLPPS
jgi:CheY-like chemotaxis protein